MKFLCPSCKAKYQIADEKVAGRSVRMKCRKCGHLIHVSSADAIAGSSAPPPVDDGDGADPIAVETPPPAKTGALAPPPRVEKSKPLASPSVAGKPPPPANKATLVGGAAAPAAPSATETPAPAKSRLPAPTKPAPSAAKLSPPAKPAAAAAPAARASADAAPAAARVPPRAGTGAAPFAAASALAASSKAPVVARKATLPMGAPAPRVKLADDDGEEEATRIAAPGALAGAFSAAVAEHAPAAVADPLNMPGDEWFVGINGVPVGPIRLSELRSKAASGAITKESLVWRDGFEEWRPLKSFPELAAIVEEGLSSTRASMPLDAAGAAPGAAAAAGRPATLADPFAPPASQVSATPGAAVTGAAVVTDDIAGFRRRSGTSPAAWIAMVVAVLFGITLGFVFFGRNQPVAEKTEKPAEKATEKPVPTAVAKQEATPEETVVNVDPKAVSKGSSGAVKTATKTETDSKLTGGLKGLGLSGLSANGPKGPGDVNGNAPSAGGTLDAGQLQSTVARYTPSVKRGCWQPALDSRDKDAPASARVSVAITIAPSGSVQNVSTNGDPRGYRGLANCIAGRVRGWQFPASGSGTTVNVPFVFVAQ